RSHKGRRDGRRVGPRARAGGWPTAATGRARARAAGRSPPPPRPPTAAAAAGCSCPTSGGRSTTACGPSATRRRSPTPSSTACSRTTT
uniref:Uncharacterized protein n=1 Tax=Aegilops tauschii subsp. strangulata TaxID=200361 RepID=A0A453DJ97_AEGTS